MNILQRLFGKRTKSESPKPERKPAIQSPKSLSGKRAGRISTDTASETTIFAATEYIASPESAYETWRRQNLNDLTLSRISATRLVELMADVSPEVNRALWDFLRFCNPGWELKAFNLNSDGVEHTAGQKALDEMIDTLTGLYGSVDVQINRLFISAFLRGAFMAEVVLDENGRDFVDFVTPDPSSARFKKIRDKRRGIIWQLGQWQGGHWVDLDLPTIAYIPLDPLPGQPYGRSLMGSAIFSSLFLIGLLHDLRRVIAQQGYPRLDLSVSLEKLMEAMPADLESDPDRVKKWIDDIIDEIADVYEELEPDDAYVHTDVVSVNRPVGTVNADSLGAVDGIIRALERMLTRALKSNSLLMVTNESVSETHANRQWEIHVAGIKSIQHLCETLIERLFKVALRAQGIQANVEMRFAELRASEMLRDAQTETMLIANAARKRDEGWISQDEASEEVTGHPADVPEPRNLQTGVGELIWGDGEGEEPTRFKIQRMNYRAVQIIPEGSENPLPDVPDEVLINERDIEQSIDLWDELMPNYAEMLEAAVIGRVDFDNEDGILYVWNDLTDQFERANGDDPLWIWNQNTKRYRNTATGQFTGQRKMVELRDVFIDRQKGRIAGQELTEKLANGEITIQRWTLRQREIIKQTFVDQYVMAKGGRNNMTQADWGRLGRMCRDQYDYLQNFGQDIADGKLSVSQIRNRSMMYIDSSTQAFEKGKQASYGMPSLSQTPGDGQTICRCITTPESKILTSDGWKSIKDIQEGDYVFTHKLRYKKVLATIIKPSLPYHQQIFIKSPTGKWIGATDNHKWYTPFGWLDSKGIDKYNSPIYHHRGVKNEKMQEMQCQISKQCYSQVMQEMSADLRMRQSKGSPGETMSILRNEHKSQETVGQPKHQKSNDKKHQNGQQETTAIISRYSMEISLAAKKGWQTLSILLGRKCQENHLPLSMALDYTKRRNTRGLSYSPYQSQSIGRQARKSSIDEIEYTSQVSRTISKGDTTPMDMRILRERVQTQIQEGAPEQILFARLPYQGNESKCPQNNLSILRGGISQEGLSQQSSITKILFAGMLQIGTPLYDLVVEDDHSFLIEGLFAHNSNCRCYLDIREDENEWRVYWVANKDAELCPDCEDLASEWNPLVIPKSRAGTQMELERILEIELEAGNE